MKMHLDSTTGNLISDYGPNGIQVNGEIYLHHLVVNTTTIIGQWDVETVGELTLSHLEPVLALEPEIILLGSGQRHIFPPIQLQAELSQRGAALEVMTTSAACRTYNVLAAEHRNVAAALFQIEEIDADSN